MKFKWSPEEGKLKGACVFLSASVPDPKRHPRYLDGPASGDEMLRLLDQRIDDAVQSLVARVLGEGGRIVHGGHPKIYKPLGKQASQWETKSDKKPILIYQSEIFKDLTPPPGRGELEESGVARILWVPVNWKVVGEKFGVPLGLLEGVLPEQGPPDMSTEKKGALLAMRVQMLMETQPESAVCIGGMEGIEAEARLFNELVKSEFLPKKAKTHIVRETYGAAAKMMEDVNLGAMAPNAMAAAWVGEVGPGVSNFGVACDRYMTDFVDELGKGR